MRRLALPDELAPPGRAPGGVTRRSRCRIRVAVGGSLLAWILLPLAGARAQMALPDIKLTPRNVFQDTFQQRSWQGEPVLAATGTAVFGGWASVLEADHVALGWSYSADRGSLWQAGPALPPLLSGAVVNGPVAIDIDRAGGANILASSIIEQYYRSPVPGFPAFGTPIIAVSALGTLHDIKSLASDPASGFVYASYTEKSGSYPHLIYPIRFIRSPDGGQTWQPPFTLSSIYCDGSSLALGPDGELYVAWMDYQQGRLVGRKSTDHGDSFSPEFTIATPHDNLGTHMKGWTSPIFTERFNPWFVYGSSTYAPNYPRIAVDVSTGPTRGRVYAAWAEHAAGTVAPATATIGEVEDNSSFATAQVIALNTDWTGFLVGYEFGDFDLDIFAFDGQAGQTIQFSAELLGDGFPGPISPEYPWVIYGTAPDGTVVGVYSGAMARATVSPPVRPSIITLPRTGRYYVAVQTSGSRAVVYGMKLREYQLAPGSVALDMRDIAIASSSDGGQTWSAPRRVNHGPGDSDQAMPNVAVDEQSRVYVAWYDRRGFALGDSVNACAAVSQDGGLTFGPDLRLSSTPSYWSGGGGTGDYVGDRIAVAAGDNYAVVAWTDFRNGISDPDVYAARIVNDGPTAVLDVSDFDAATTAGGVRLSWHVNDVHAVSGLRVYRRQEEGGEETPLGTEDIAVRAAGAFEYLDRTAEPGVSYSYRLRIARGSGADWLGPVTVTLPAEIRALAWRGARPNPFATATELRLAVPGVADGAVRVYDIQGHEVRTLRQGRFEPGELSLAWDGRDARGSAVAPGVYFLAANVGPASVRMKLARVR